MHTVSFRASEGLVEARPADRDLNVNGHRGILGPRSTTAGSDQQAGTSTCSSSGEEIDEVPGPFCRRPSHEHHPPLNNQGRTNQLNCPPKSLITSSFNDPENSGPGSLGMAAFLDPSPAVKPNVSKNRQRQLESLRRMEERICKLSRTGSSGSSNIPTSNVPTAARINPASANNINVLPSPSPSKS